MSIMIRAVLLPLLLTLTLTQNEFASEGRTKAQQVSKKQQQIRAQNNMTYTNIQSYTFLCGRFDDFIIKPTIDEIIKFEMHIYWRKQNVYVTAEYQQGEEIRVIVYEDNQRALLDREFYLMTGFSFMGKKGSTYTVRFLAAGKVAKLVSMINSSPLLRVSDDLATKEHIDSAQTKVETIGNELKALLTISQRNYLMKDKVVQKILSSTKLYMAYQIIEVILIIGVAILQVTSLTRLLKGGSIV